MQLLGPIVYSPEEQIFTKEMQLFLKYSQDGITDQPPEFSDHSKREALYGYASDIGEASWIAPEIYFVVSSLPDVPMHQWPGTAFTGHSIGHKGMLQASKILSLTVIDYVEDKILQESINKDFLNNIRGYKYKPLIQRPAASIIKEAN